jgi:hypothetical protein
MTEESPSQNEFVSGEEIVDLSLQNISKQDIYDYEQTIFHLLALDSWIFVLQFTYYLYLRYVYDKVADAYQTILNSSVAPLLLEYEEM